MWFFALDQIFKIKNEQIKMLQKIRDTKVDNIMQLNPKDQDSLITEDQQPGQILKQLSERYEGFIKNMEEFFKSRIDFVIENTLKYIELEEFLKHMVRNDGNIKFSELSDMINSIFLEVNSEQIVLTNANRSAQQ